MARKAHADVRARAAQAAKAVAETAMAESGQPDPVPVSDEMPKKKPGWPKGKPRKPRSDA